GDRFVGGLCGSISGGVITRSFATGEAGGSWSVGGLCGLNYCGRISESYSTSAVSGAVSGSGAGGLCGYNDGGTISRSYATGAVSGGHGVGGLCGSSHNYSVSLSWTGEGLGGLFGWGTIEDCYAAGAVSGTGGSVGGLIGESWGPVDRCVWDVETSGQTDSACGKGATTEQMKSMRLYQDAGWAGKGWVINRSVDYPRLAWEGTEGAAVDEPGALPLAGNGTEADPYRIYTGEEFASLSQYWMALDGHFVLMNDVDLAGVALRPIGELGAFKGVFDGRGYVLRNATIHRAGSTDVGIWATIGFEGQLRNVRAEEIDVRGGFSVGGLAGLSNGRITNCQVTGTVHGVGKVGGLAGCSNGEICSSGAAVSVSGGEEIGGLCGWNTWVISDCHASGDVTGIQSVGGLCGFNDGGTINECRATGAVRGTNNVGGLCGKNLYGTISGCSAAVSVSGDEDLGGLCGNNCDGIISDCSATGSVSGNQNIGGLCGSNEYGSISNCIASGSVSGDRAVGGLCGWNGGTIRTSSAGGQVDGGGDSRYLGGLCGENGIGSISNSCSTAQVTGAGESQYLGGLCGYNASGTIYKCRAAGRVKGGRESMYAAGLCGKNNGTISNCSAAGEVTGGPYLTKVGGLCAVNRGTISNCYAAASLSGVYLAGGLCETNYGTISDSYSAGPMPGSLHKGGLCRQNLAPGVISNCFWDTQTSGTTASDGGTPKTTAEMQQVSTFTDFADSRWDFVGEAANGTEDVWRMCSNGVSYPRLSWEYSRGGDFDCPDGVGLEDLRYLAERWLAADVEAVGAADGNGDRRVDMGDFGLMAERWRGGTDDDMVLIPGGTFEMGDNLDDISLAPPVHTVTLTSFCMSKYETTNGQYCEFLSSAWSQGLIAVSNGVVYKSQMNYPYCDTSASTDSQINYSDGVFSVRTKGGRDMSNDPMTQVSWYGAAAYCNWRSEQEGLEPCYDLSTWDCDFTKNGYRLPTEAQWEYAARGGLSGRRFPWGDMINHDHANYRAVGSAFAYDTGPSSTWGTCHPAWNDGTAPYTSPVGSFPPNGYGLYDMAGNAHEWCNDWYSSSYYGSSLPTDPTGPAQGSDRVLRGGSWISRANVCGVAQRDYLSPVFCSGNQRCGFRVCR
ncbi:MAG: formylglycine-generating enzyme family protein, partial [Phycisphaerae bacterium]|nr:formylglycine-generating enzyme family protein [Phycisphaerae bacterium]